MSSPHLRLERARHGFRVEQGAFFGDHDLEREVEQEIAELVAQLDGVVAADRLIELEDFFYEVRAQRRRGLRAIPRAPLAQVADECEGAPKR
jgi:hypothetical protein